MLFTPEDFKNAAGTSQDFLREAAQGALTAACQLYQDFPRGFGIDNPVGDAVERASSGIWDSLCGGMPNPTLPPPPTTPPPGGQCCNKEYIITIQFMAAPFSGGVCQEFAQGPFELPIQRTGKVVDIRNSSDGRIIEYVREDCSGNRTVEEVTQRDSFCRKPVGYTIQIAPGFEPDNCGDRPGGYGGSLPPSNNPFSFPYSGNDGVSRDINVDIEFGDGPTISPTINFPDFPNICASFNAFGVDIDLCSNKPPDGGGGGISPEDLQRLLDAADKVDDIKDDVDDLGRKRPPLVEPKGEQDNDTEEDTGELYGILVDITFIPTGTGREFGQPQKFNFGRAYFKRGDFYSQEIPLTTVRQWVPALPDSTGYAISFQKGVKANITVIKPPSE